MEAESQRKDAKIKDLQNRLFGKKSEKQGSAKSEKEDNPTSERKRGQQPGRGGHGRTPRPDLPVVPEVRDLPEDTKQCPTCHLPYLPKPGLDEHNEFIEVEVKAHTRHIHRPAYVRNPGCCCPGTPMVITTPPPSRLIPRSPYQVSFWVEVLLSKYRYAQPTHRYLQDLSDRALPVSPGTVAGGLQAIAPLFEPIMEGLYQKQMTETLFHNDETRWEVFVELADKVGTRWYLWVTRSPSVVFFVLDPSRSAAVPGAHFAGLQNERVIIVCDRYSAYKKLARLSDAILLAFCWAHVRRDFLNAGRGYKELEAWALEWKERIGALYHHNRLRLEHWDSERPLDQQTEAFDQHHQTVQELLHEMHQEATRLTGEEDSLDEQTRSLSKSARKQQRKICQSLLDHWPGLTLFVDNPQVPLDNNLAENTIRGPVNGRKNYYGSGSLWSAQLAAALFSIFKTLELWGINPRHWLSAYLCACADNGGKAPTDIASYLPWEMNQARRDALSRPASSITVPDTS
ncbi:MAG: IS66 family transposase [bacterium]|nr:IS66 family transposase [bacterium]